MYINRILPVLILYFSMISVLKSRPKSSKKSKIYSDMLLLPAFFCNQWKVTFSLRLTLFVIPGAFKSRILYCCVHSNPLIKALVINGNNRDSFFDITFGYHWLENTSKLIYSQSKNGLQQRSFTSFYNP